MHRSVYDELKVRGKVVQNVTFYKYRPMNRKRHHVSVTKLTSNGCIKSLLMGQKHFLNEWKGTLCNAAAGKW